MGSLFEGFYAIIAANIIFLANTVKNEKQNDCFLVVVVRFESDKKTFLIKKADSNTFLFEGLIFMNNSEKFN